MSSIILRSALVFWGHNPGPEVHSVVVAHRGPGGRRVVTWADVMEARRKRQREQLRRKLATDEWRAYKLWVAYFDQNLMGGWHAFLEDYRGGSYRIWIDRDRPWLKPKLMEAFPLLLPLGTEREQWERWKVEFAQRFNRRQHDRRPLGVAYVWWNERDCPRPVAEQRGAESIATALTESSSSAVEQEQIQGNDGALGRTEVHSSEVGSAQ